MTPGFATLVHYQRAWLRGDLVAGATVAAYLVPQVMAYATVAGLPPVTGLWAALPALVIYALLGSSPSLSLGPEATTALMTAIAIGPLATGNPARYAQLAASLALLVGVIALAAGLLRLGFVADLLSRPVLVGYMAGVGLIMIADQLQHVTGATVTGQTFFAQLTSFVRDAWQVQPATLAVAAGVLIFLFLVSARWPGRTWPAAGGGSGDRGRGRSQPGQPWRAHCRPHSGGAANPADAGRTPVDAEPARLAGHRGGDRRIHR